MPRYLPRYGMAPDWTRASRPMVLVFTAIAFLITVVFGAEVETQGGAYATGVLALILSAAVAVTLSAWTKGRVRPAIFFGVVTLFFAYATVANIIERPDGLVIALLFVLAIVVVSLVSRATRSTELRVTSISLDDAARRFVNEAGELYIIANEPNGRDAKEYVDKAREAWELHRLRTREGLLFLEVTVPGRLRVRRGTARGRRGAPRLPGPAHAEHDRRQRHRRPAAAPARRDRQDPARLLPLGRRGQPHRRPAALPRLRRRRHPAADPRGPAPGRTRPGPPPIVHVG